MRNDVFLKQAQNLPNWALTSTAVANHASHWVGFSHGSSVFQIQEYSLLYWFLVVCRKIHV